MNEETITGIDESAICGAGCDKLGQITVDWLARAKVKLAIVESATGGEVACLLRTADGGDSVVADAYVVDGPEMLAAQLGMSLAKLEAFGWVSQMSAAEAAANLIDTYEGGWGLAILGDPHAGGDVQGDETGLTFVALGTPDATLVRRIPCGSSGPAHHGVVLQTLDLLRRQAIARSEAGS